MLSNYGSRVLRFAVRELPQKLRPTTQELRPTTKGVEAVNFTYLLGQLGA
jgi:hypothetical protein